VGVSSPRPGAVTIGFFDGVHLGHRRIVGELARVATERGLAAVVLTFDRHPASVVRPGSAPLLLTDLDQRVELLLAAGADEVRVLPFDVRRASEEAPEFVRSVLAGDLAARVVIVGSDFHFGHERRGNVALLRAMGGELGFDVVAYDLVPDPAEGEVVSSTRIRGLLAAGDVERAARLLGRPHEVRGEAAGAPGRAARLVVPADIALPAPGRYRAEVTDRAGAEVAEPVEAEVRAPVAPSDGQDGAPRVVELRRTSPAGWPPGATRVRFLAPSTSAGGAAAAGDAAPRVRTGD
jgi:riboflavin kinase/FMN adenylyltransferase